MRDRLVAQWFLLLQLFVPVAHPAQLAPSIAAAPPSEAPVPAPPVVASIVAPVVAAPALAPQVHVAAVQEVSASQSRGFIAEYWRLLIALALLPIAVWGWRWWAYRRIYDSSGLPRGPRL